MAQFIVASAKQMKDSMSSSVSTREPVDLTKKTTKKTKSSSSSSSSLKSSQSETGFNGTVLARGSASARPPAETPIDTLVNILVAENKGEGKPVANMPELMKDRSKAQYDPALCNKCLDYGYSLQNQHQFYHNPLLYNIDCEKWSDERVKESNKGTWLEKCFPEPDPVNGLVPAQSYHSRFHGQASVLSDPDLFMPSTATSVTLSFTLEEGLTHSQFIHKTVTQSRGIVELTISGDVIRKAVSKQLPGINWEKTPYHINVFDIRCMREDSNFLIEFDKQLVTRSQLEGHKDEWQSWSEVHEIDSAAKNIPEDKSYPNRVYNRIRVGDKEVNERSQGIYLAPAMLNGSEYARWINRDWKDIYARLKRHGDNAYLVTLPDTSTCQSFDFLSWFIFDEMEEIDRRTQLLPEEDSEPHEMPEHSGKIRFNQLFYCNGLPQPHVLISKTVLDALLEAKETLFNQDRLLMNLNDVKLILQPLQGMAGWETYQQIASDREKVVQFEKERVRYSASIQIACSKYKHATTEH